MKFSRMHKTIVYIHKKFMCSKERQINDMEFTFSLSLDFPFQKKYQTGPSNVTMTFFYFVINVNVIRRLHVGMHLHGELCEIGDALEFFSPGEKNFFLTK